MIRIASSHTRSARSLIARSLAVRLALALIALLLSVGSAQSVSIDALVGSWQTSIPNPGGPTVEVLFHVLPDGRYREEGYWQGQLAGFWEGSLQIAPDGTLTMRESNVSPQICFGECMANDAPTTVTARLVAMTQSSVTLVYDDPEYGPSDPVVWQRSGAAPQAIQAPTQPQLPTTQQPLQPQTPAMQALPNAGDPWAGTYSDGDLTLVLVGPGGDYIERGGVRYPLQLQGDTQLLQGMFQSGSDTFPVTLERTATGIVLSTGGARFDLRPVAGAVATGNPLGN